MAEQTAFGDVTFAENPEPRCPCVLLLDTSGSMTGERIASLNTGLFVYRDEISSDSLASKRVEVAALTFGGTVDTIVEFTTPDTLQFPALIARGETPMGGAIRKAVEMVKQRKDDYRRNGIMFYRPWIFMLTDGEPSDEWKSAAAAVAEGERSKSFAFFAVGVEGANMDILRQISPREPLSLSGLRFRELFKWLSNSQQSVSRSRPGDEVPLESPKGWASV